MGTNGKLSLPFRFLLCLFICAVFPYRAFCGSEGDAGYGMAREDEQAEGTFDLRPSTYRQKLGKVVVPEDESYSHGLDNYLRFMPSCGVSGQSGRVSIVDTATEYNYNVKIFGQLPVEFAVGEKYISIVNSTAVDLPSRLTSVFFGVETTLPFFAVKNTYFTIGLAPVFDTGDWGIRSSALSFVQRYFFIYQLDEKMVFVSGVSIAPHEKDPVMPILGFIYKPNERLTFNILPKQPEISYVLNNRLTVFGQADMTMDEYKVTRRGVKNNVLEYNEIHAGAGLRYKMNKHIQGSVSAGGVFNRSLKYRDGGGKAQIEDGMYMELRIDINV
ncbi:MAG: DUF6268 family outer membrane beta-barrel protein [Candidatus Omnitrophica bacterium]|nr:DUF6268 family outer membrane beta-barrel protein [Candidatus Omnitrophota bacterium]